MSVFSDSAELILWVQEQNEDKSPNLTKFTEHFNNMSFWCRTKILQVIIILYIYTKMPNKFMTGSSDVFCCMISARGPQRKGEISQQIYQNHERIAKTQQFQFLFGSFECFGFGTHPEIGMVQEYHGIVEGTLCFDR